MVAGSSARSHSGLDTAQMAEIHRMNELHAWVAQTTDEMASEYQRIRARATEDPGTAGDEGEENWARALDRIRSAGRGAGCCQCGPCVPTPRIRRSGRRARHNRASSLASLAAARYAERLAPSMVCKISCSRTGMASAGCCLARARATSSLRRRVHPPCGQRPRPRQCRPPTAATRTVGFRRARAEGTAGLAARRVSIVA